MKNAVQLITYVDRLGGGGLPELAALLGPGGALAGVFGGVHLLPFFHPIDGADAGFDPIDHTRVDPRLGTWGDLAALARHLDVMGDVIVNHMSSRSPQFLDFSARGDDSRYAGMFLTLAKVYPQGAREKDLLAVYRPRAGLPFSITRLANGDRTILWTTFTPQQVDIDVAHAEGRAYLDGILAAFATNGIRMARLDAVGYAIKRPGTSCFLLPETLDFISHFAAHAKTLGVEVLVEVHAHHQRQIEIARRVDWVYDFVLPPLLLHALAFKTAVPLAGWIAQRPRNAVTVLDTHDGIGIIDIGADAADPQRSPGLVPPEELDQLVETIHTLSKGASRAATGEAASNLDIYQVNCTYFDALGGDEDAYLIARAVQFFVPGVPQVYYVGLLAGHNDMALLRQTGVGRDINRHRFDAAEIAQSLARPVVRQLLRLIALRNGHPAFGGAFSVEPTPVSASAPTSRIHLRWAAGAHWARLQVDFATRSAALVWSSQAGPQHWQIGPPLTSMPVGA